jgi:hypothetical protein
MKKGSLQALSDQRDAKEIELFRETNFNVTVTG